MTNYGVHKQECTHIEDYVRTKGTHLEIINFRRATKATNKLRPQTNICKHHPKLTFPIANCIEHNHAHTRQMPLINSCTTRTNMRDQLKIGLIIYTSPRTCSGVQINFFLCAPQRQTLAINSTWGIILEGQQNFHIFSGVQQTSQKINQRSIQILLELFQIFQILFYEVIELA